jgi:hypothetical protein
MVYFCALCLPVNLPGDKINKAPKCFEHEEASITNRSKGLQSMSSDSIPRKVLTGHIRRVHQEGNFSIIPNGIFSDSRLSAELMGVLCYLLSRPDDWYVNPEAIAPALHLSPSTVKERLSTLGKLGYYSKNRTHSLGNGRFGWHTEVSDTPCLGDGRICRPMPTRRRKPKGEAKKPPIPYPDVATTDDAFAWDGLMEEAP